MYFIRFSRWYRWFSQSNFTLSWFVALILIIRNYRVRLWLNYWLLLKQVDWHFSMPSFSHYYLLLLHHAWLIIIIWWHRSIIWLHLHLILQGVVINRRVLLISFEAILREVIGHHLSQLQILTVVIRIFLGRRNKHVIAEWDLIGHVCVTLRSSHFLLVRVLDISRFHSTRLVLEDFMCWSFHSKLFKI